ncbi:MAG TPA: patatin family protein [Thermotogota bacterium]|nr:patatin family protein [Thermotogota bacterium]
MTGVIDVGGGLRGIFGAGVFDYCLDKEIQFDYCVGISAGSANVASYIGKQRNRNYQFYMEYSFRPQYMSFRNFLLKGSYIDLEYVYAGLSNSDGENPLNYEGIARSEKIMKIVALNALTGETVYFDKRNISQDDYRIFMASSSIPVACKPYEVNGIPCYDGGLADPVPVRKAMEDGCDKVVVILTKPRDLVRTPDKDVRMARFIRRKYKAVAGSMAMRYKKYNEGVALAKAYEKQGKALIIAPEDCCGMKTLTKSRESMQKMYDQGYSSAELIVPFLGSFI